MILFEFLRQTYIYKNQYIKFNENCCAILYIKNIECNYNYIISLLLICNVTII